MDLKDIVSQQSLEQNKGLLQNSQQILEDQIHNERDQSKQENKNQHKKKNKKKKKKNKSLAQEKIELELQHSQSINTKQLQSAQPTLNNNPKNLLITNLNSKQANTRVNQNQTIIYPLKNIITENKNIISSNVIMNPSNQTNGQKTKRRQTFQVKRQLFAEPVTKSRSVDLDISANNEGNKSNNLSNLHNNSYKIQESKVSSINLKEKLGQKDITLGQAKNLSNIFGQFFKLQNLKNYQKIKSKNTNQAIPSIPAEQSQLPQLSKVSDVGSNEYKISTANLNQKPLSNLVAESEAKTVSNMFGQFFKLQNLKNYQKIKNVDQKQIKIERQFKKVCQNQQYTNAQFLQPNSSKPHEQSIQITPKKSRTQHLENQQKLGTGLHKPNNKSSLDNNQSFTQTTKIQEGLKNKDSQSILPKIQITIRKSQQTVIVQSANPISPPSTQIKNIQPTYVNPSKQQYNQANQQNQSIISQNKQYPSSSSLKSIQLYQKQLPPMIVQQRQALQQSPLKLQNSFQKFDNLQKDDNSLFELHIKQELNFNNQIATSSLSPLNTNINENFDKATHYTFAGKEQPKNGQQKNNQEIKNVVLNDFIDANKQQSHLNNKKPQQVAQQLYIEPQFKYLNKQLTSTPLIQEQVASSSHSDYTQAHQYLKSNQKNNRIVFTQSQPRDQSQISFGLQFTRPIQHFESQQTNNDNSPCSTSNNNSFFQSSTIPLNSYQFPSFTEHDIAIHQDNSTSLHKNNYPQMMHLKNNNHNQNIHHQNQTNNISAANIHTNNQTQQLTQRQRQIQVQCMSYSTFIPHLNGNFHNSELSQSSMYSSSIHNHRNNQKRQVQFVPISDQVRNIEVMFKHFNIQNKLSIDNLSYNSNFQTFENISSNLINEMEKNAEDQFMSQLLKDKQKQWTQRILGSRKQHLLDHKAHNNVSKALNQRQYHQLINKRQQKTISQPNKANIYKISHSNGQSKNNFTQKVMLENVKLNQIGILSQFNDKKINNNQEIILQNQKHQTQINQPKPTQRHSPVKQFHITKLYEQKIVPIKVFNQLSDQKIVSSHVKQPSSRKIFSQGIQTQQTTTVKPLQIKRPLKFQQTNLKRSIYDDSLQQKQSHFKQNPKLLSQIAHNIESKQISKNNINSYYQILQSSKQDMNSNSKSNSRYKSGNFNQNKSYKSIQQNSQAYESDYMPQYHFTDNKSVPVQNISVYQHKHQLKGKSKPLFIENVQSNATRVQRSISFGKKQHYDSGISNDQRANIIVTKETKQFILPKQTKIQDFIKPNNILLQSQISSPLSKIQYPMTFRAGNTNVTQKRTQLLKAQNISSNSNTGRSNKQYQTLKNTLNENLIQNPSMMIPVSYRSRLQNQTKTNQIQKQKEVYLPVRKIHPIKLSEITLSAHGKQIQKQSNGEQEKQYVRIKPRLQRQHQISKQEDNKTQGKHVQIPNLGMGSFLLNTSHIGSFMMNNVIKSLTQLNPLNKKQQQKTLQNLKQNKNQLNKEITNNQLQSHQFSAKKKITIKKSTSTHQGKKLSINQHHILNPINRSLEQSNGSKNNLKNVAYISKNTGKNTEDKNNNLSSSHQTIKQSVSRINQKVQSQIRNLSKSKRSENANLMENSNSYEDFSYRNQGAKSDRTQKFKVSLNSNFTPKNKNINFGQSYKQNSVQKSIKNSRKSSMSRKKSGIQLWNQGLSQLKSSRRNSGSKSPKIFKQSTLRQNEKIVGITRWNQNLSRFKKSRSQSRQSRKSIRSNSNSSNSRRQTRNLQQKHTLNAQLSSSKKIGIQVKKHKYQVTNIQKRYL